MNKIDDFKTIVSNRAELVLMHCMWHQFYKGESGYLSKLVKRYPDESISDLITLLVRIASQVRVGAGFSVNDHLFNMDRQFIPIGFSSLGLDVVDYEYMVGAGKEDLSIIKWHVKDHYDGKGELFLYAFDDGGSNFDLSPGIWVNELKNFVQLTLQQWEKDGWKESRFINRNLGDLAGYWPCDDVHGLFYCDED